MNTRELFIKIANAKRDTSIILLDDIDKINDDFKEYYCANKVEKLYECDTKLVYVKKGGFGFNYRYCSSCYDKWNKSKAENFSQKNK